MKKILVIVLASLFLLTPVIAFSFFTSNPFSSSSKRMVKEDVTCIFLNSQYSQTSCYSASEGLELKYGCSGLESCTVRVKEKIGTEIMWKSNCGDYDYTTADGTPELIKFDCSNFNPNPTPEPTSEPTSPPSGGGGGWG